MAVLGAVAGFGSWLATGQLLSLLGGAVSLAALLTFVSSWKQGSFYLLVLGYGMVLCSLYWLL